MTTAPARPASIGGKVVSMLEMIRFSHTLFALPFAVLGALLASRNPDGAWIFRPLDWLGITLCMVGARSSAMAFNRLVDRRLDATNPRTASRHLPAGRLGVGEVILFTIASAGVFVLGTLLFLPRNPWPIRLALPVLAWLLGYSYAKRFTSLVHFWLGLSLALAPVAAWIAIRGDVAPAPLWLGLAVLLWVTGFDILYACQDIDHDRQSGLHSIPSRLGVRNALRLAALCHAGMVGALVGLGLAYPLGRIYALGVASAAALLLYEHALVRPDDLTRVNRAFFHVNIAISLGLLAVGAADLCLTSAN
jgi:4-hydroxybenzoate polyprenyltransferase